MDIEVVGGTEQPANPNENTIWINTDQPITGWAFNTEEPDEPYEGMVWIEVGSISNVVINVLNENELVVRLSKAKYFHNSEWYTVSVEVYKNGEWVKLAVDNKLYLFKNGTGYTNGYQGFICVTGEPNSPDTQTNVINWSNLKSYGASVYFSPPISFEVGKYKTLNFEIRCSGRYSTEHSVVIGVGADKAKSHSECGTFDASKSGIYSEDITVYSVDVSNMSGLKYVKLGGFGVTGDIYNVWLD